MSVHIEALREVWTARECDGIEEAWEDYQGRTGVNDRDLFVQYLYQQGSISEDALRRALTIRLRPEVTNLHRIEERLRGNDSAQRTYAETSPNGRYALLGQLGHGATGDVFVGKDHDLKRKVAFKLLSDTYDNDQGLRQRFLAEVQITAQLDHPSVIPVYGLEVGSDGVGYAMKLVQGDTLYQLILGQREEALAGGASISLAERLDLFLRVCDGVAYAHSRGVLHRDLKPENVMVGRFGEVYVMDWGLARLLGAEEKERTAHRPAKHPGQTHEGHAVGTPSYMSPEQARGDHDLGPSSDIYALGIILQELVTLSAACDGATVQAVLIRASTADRNSIRHVAGKKIHPPLRAIIDKACELRPDARYASVAELAADVKAYLRDEPVQALRESLFRKLGRALARNREFVLSAVFIAALGGAGVMVTGLLFIQAAQVAATWREHQLARVLRVASEQAHTIDKEVLRYELLLASLASSAEIALTNTAPTEGELYTASDFDVAERKPRTHASERYRREVSFHVPSFALAPGVTREAALPEMGRMAHLETRLERLLGTEHSQETNQGIGWVYVGTERGVHLSYPGHGGYPDGYDPRKRPWYSLSENQPGLNWGNPYRDANGLGLILPVSTSIRGPAGELLGVAGIDVTFDYLTERLMIPESLDFHHAYLLDEQGRMVVQAGGKMNQPLDDDALKLTPYRHEVVRTAAAEHSSGHTTIDGDLVVWFPLSALGWTYVLEAPEATLLSD